VRPPSLTLSPAQPGRLAGHDLADADADADAVAVAVSPGDDGPRPGPGGAEAAEAVGVDLPAVLAGEKAKGEPGEVVSVPVTARADGTDTTVTRLLAVGVGDGAPQSLRRAGAALARRAKGRTRVVASVVQDAPAEGVRAFAEGLLLGAYGFTRRSEPKSPGPVERVDLLAGAPGAEDALRRAVVVGEAVWLARDLANTPSNEKTPDWLAAEAVRLAGGALQARIWDETELAADGFGGILAVGSGSSRPPRFIQLAYTPEGAGDGAGLPLVVLVGKGITFDSGGLSLKPREFMVPMKTDMSGGAAVLGAMSALAALGVRVRVTGLVAAAENLPSGSAMRPGDVLTQYGGTTVEVFNTDAEGRLVLADALAYARDRLDPDAVVDLATLTGAASRGLGRRHAALYATDDGLAQALIEAGEASGERLWRMPLVEDYRPSLDSDVADLAHISRDATVQGGSITAALFLREFAGKAPWAHLDIAGPARSDAEEHEVNKGGTGFGTRTLLRWLEAATPETVRR
jgi:leucyl aminopeptidase